ncbi:hypothetical protein [Sphingobacterium bovistauri]|uniref:Uncharacterized protein n=1 Tax=Sphingobacterium bovistauri TaxID=2781959 RepID=A0ABS7Z4N1_9SPHI|nr:hypothetical protein [Sphingobacterium bovistauri]MCA5005153.1 hypothetical protein [Sphingobacterium bovistauri]
MTHTFHIPVLGLAFSIDSPIKVAQYGISSVISIVDDELIERMRKYYASQIGKLFTGISSQEEDARAKRITAYLDLVQDIVTSQIEELKKSTQEISDSLKKYIDLQPTHSPMREAYTQYLTENSSEKKHFILSDLLTNIKAGSIDVNIMSKVDKINYDKKGNELDAYYSDASAALRGFVNSKIKSSVVLSAGMNPRLYSYIAELPQFLPNINGGFDKKITLKVSDYRSALIQAKFLAKKGVWISEYRVESGLNCGGHAFATDGFLLGPILDEFKQKRAQLQEELFPLYHAALLDKKIKLEKAPTIKITAQGGIGTAAEQNFLLNHYELDATGWGSPFLLVPEATTVDDNTLNNLATAKAEDFYISGASPLGVPFNNFKKSTSEILRESRIQKGRPGAPCTKKYLVTPSNYQHEPMCSASRIYQHLKIAELQELQLNEESYATKLAEITEKTCLCEGLANAAYLKYNILEKKESDTVAICPGPNTAYFDRVYSLQEMVDHIYGRQDLLNHVERPSLFINELRLYIAHLTKYIHTHQRNLDTKKEKYILKFKEELLSGITYYRNIRTALFEVNSIEYHNFNMQLEEAENQITSL